MKMISQWILAVAVLSALLVWGPRAYAAEPSRDAGDIMMTNIVCNELSIKALIGATTEGETEAAEMLDWVVYRGGCVTGPYMVKIVAPAYTWEDFEGDIFQVWEIQPAHNPPPNFPTFTWEHIGGPNHPSNLMQQPAPFRFGQPRRHNI